MYGCQQNLIQSTPELEFVCSRANKFTNQGIYFARQLYFKTGKCIKKYDLDKEYKKSRHYKAFYSQVAQPVLLSLWESFKSYKELLKLWKSGKLAEKPKRPNYRKKGGLTVVSYPKQTLKLHDDRVRVPLGKLVKAWFGIDHFYVEMHSNLNFNDIRELRILPRNGYFYLVVATNPSLGTFCSYMLH